MFFEAKVISESLAYDFLHDIEFINTKLEQEVCQQMAP